MPKTGTFSLTQNGLKASVTIKVKNGKYIIRDAESGKYLALDKNGKAFLSDFEFSWYYNGGFYAFATTKYLRIPYSVCYLTLTKNGFNVTKKPVKVILYETKRAYKEK